MSISSAFQSTISASDGKSDGEYLVVKIQEPPSVKLSLGGGEAVRADIQCDRLAEVAFGLLQSDEGKAAAKIPSKAPFSLWITTSRVTTSTVANCVPGF